jgi:hypothetical protein
MKIKKLLKILTHLILIIITPLLMQLIIKRILNNILHLNTLIPESKKEIELKVPMKVIKHIVMLLIIKFPPIITLKKIKKIFPLDIIFILNNNLSINKAMLLLPSHKIKIITLSFFLNKMDNKEKSLMTLLEINITIVPIIIIITILKIMSLLKLMPLLIIITVIINIENK